MLPLERYFKLASPAGLRNHYWNHFNRRIA
jgi:hypothetical protein